MLTSNDSPGFQSQSGFKAVRSLAHSLLLSYCGWRTNLTHCLPSGSFFLGPSKRTSFRCARGTLKVMRGWSTSSGRGPELGMSSFRVTPPLHCKSNSEKMVAALSSADKEDRRGSTIFFMRGASALVKASMSISTSSESSAHMFSIRQYCGWARRKVRNSSFKPSGFLTWTPLGPSETFRPSGLFSASAASLLSLLLGVNSPCQPASVFMRWAMSASSLDMLFCRALCMAGADLPTGTTTEQRMLSLLASWSSSMCALMVHWLPWLASTASTASLVIFLSDFASSGLASIFEHRAKGAKNNSNCNKVCWKRVSVS
mmetsp:Transcript_111179/g.319470  ORF Transcript_111179/g.319470 Transcript_111179/m.319470 type:complete len:315 (+) Transcript_111179:962-1906(+)